MEVYKSISSVITAISGSGIPKARVNQQQGFKFRSVEDIYNALSPLLAEAQLVIIPRVLSRQMRETTTKNGGAMYYVIVEVEYDFISAIDGSKHTARSIGEASDSGDKATNKAITAAYKYMVQQVFCIPTEGSDNDADYHTHEGGANFAQQVWNAIQQLRQCTTIDSLKALKQSLPAEIVSSEAFQSEGKEKYSELTQHHA